MTKAELESKHLAELHALAAEAGVPGYRMLRREELIEKLLGGEAESQPRGERRAGGERERARRQRSRGGSRERGQRSQRREQPTAEEKEAEEPAPARREERTGSADGERPRPRRKRRRRFGRRRREVRVSDLLLPPVAGRQAIVYGESREGCTALLRELAGEIAEANGADPVAVLVDPGPEELADWRREAPRAEIVAAATARHAEDALAQAGRRAEGGEQVVVLIDSLTRFAESFGDAEAAKDLLEGPAEPGSGSVTVVAAVERR